MQEIEQRSDGVWRPSPGSVYPALQQLEDEGLVEQAGEGRKAYTLTDEGRADVEEHARGARHAVGRRQGRHGRGRLGADGRHAPDRHGALPAHPLGDRGEQRAEAREVLAETRRSLYRILSEEPEE